MAGRKTPRSDAKVDAEAAAAQTATSQASQADNATGAQQVRSAGFEGTHKFATDIGVEEAISSLVLGRVADAFAQSKTLDNLVNQILQGGVTALNRSIQNAVGEDNLNNRVSVNANWNEEEPNSTFRTKVVGDAVDEDE